MKKLMLLVACVTGLVTNVTPASAQASNYALYTCFDGVKTRYNERGEKVSGPIELSVPCTQRADDLDWVRVFQSIDGTGLKSQTEDPPCGDGASDNGMKDLAKAVALGLGADADGVRSVADTFDRIARLCGSLDGVGRNLCMAATGRPSFSQCKAFAVKVPVPIRRIRYIEFSANQGNASDDPACFDARVEVNPQTKQPWLQLKEHATTNVYKKDQPDTNAGGCRISYSGWSGVTLTETESGEAVVGAIFKNWSNNRHRTGDLFVVINRP